MKSPRFFRMFGYDTKLLPNKYLAKLETGVTSIEDAREKTGATIGMVGGCFITYCFHIWTGTEKK